jgi:hypothetical protein
MGRVMANSIMTHTALNKLLTLPETLIFINAQGTAVTEANIEKTDDCFNAMSSYWQKGDYLDILTLADIQATYSLCDIRIAVYYLYSLWVIEVDISSEYILSTLLTLLSHHQQPWKAMLVNNKGSVDKILANGVSILLRKIVDHLNNPTCKNNANSEDPEQVLPILAKLAETLQQLTTDNRLHSSLIAAKDYYLNLAKEQHSAGHNTRVNESQDQLEANAKHAISAADLAISPSASEPNLFKSSSALQNLFARMQLLEALLQKQQFLKAAVVLTDIQNELDNFKPLIYFPEYFSPFACTRAQSAAQLEPYFNLQDSFQWQALNECYKTDMQAFLQLSESSVHSSQSPNLPQHTAFETRDNNE